MLGVVVVAVVVLVVILVVVTVVVLILARVVVVLVVLIVAFVIVVVDVMTPAARSLMAPARGVGGKSLPCLRISLASAVGMGEFGAVETGELL